MDPRLRLPFFVVVAYVALFAPLLLVVPPKYLLLFINIYIDADSLYIYINIDGAHEAPHDVTLSVVEEILRSDSRQGCRLFCSIVFSVDRPLSPPRCCRYSSLRASKNVLVWMPVRAYYVFARAGFRRPSLLNADYHYF